MVDQECQGELPVEVLVFDRQFLERTPSGVVGHARAEGVFDCGAGRTLPGVTQLPLDQPHGFVLTPLVETLHLEGVVLGKALHELD